MAAPAGPIQVQPAGLTGLLQLKNWGVRPDILQGSVLPNLDMEPWWLRGSMEPLVRFANAINLGAFPVGVSHVAIAQVPDREWWYVHHLAVVTQVTNNTGRVEAYLGVSLQGAVLGAVPDYTVAGPVICAPQGAADPAAAVVSARGFWVPPGGRLSYLASVINNNNTNLCTGLAVSRAPV